MAIERPAAARWHYGWGGGEGYWTWYIGNIQFRQDEGEQGEDGEDVPGRIWCSCGALEVGDYGGAADVGDANIRALERDRPDEETWTERGPHGFRRLWLLATDENLDIVRSLADDYPLYDEAEHSRVQLEWEDEAWENWAASEFGAELERLPGGQLLREVFEMHAESRALFEEMREEADEHWVCETGGAYIRMKGIVEGARDYILSLPYGPYLILEVARDAARLSEIAPWQVVADWFEENGEDDVAELVRAAGALEGAGRAV